MKINKIAECFSKSKKPIVIICDFEDTKEMIDELKSETTYSFNLSGSFNNKRNNNIISQSVIVYGKTIHFIDESSSKEFYKLAFHNV